MSSLSLTLVCLPSALLPFHPPSLPEVPGHFSSLPCQCWSSWLGHLSTRFALSPPPQLHAPLLRRASDFLLGLLPAISPQHPVLFP